MSGIDHKTIRPGRKLPAHCVVNGQKLSKLCDNEPSKPEPVMKSEVSNTSTFKRSGKWLWIDSRSDVTRRKTKKVHGYVHPLPLARWPVTSGTQLAFQSCDQCTISEEQTWINNGCSYKFV